MLISPSAGRLNDREIFAGTITHSWFDRNGRLWIAANTRDGVGSLRLPVDHPAVDPDRVGTFERGRILEAYRIDTGSPSYRLWTRNPATGPGTRPGSASPPGTAAAAPSR